MPIALFLLVFVVICCVFGGLGVMIARSRAGAEARVVASFALGFLFGVLGLLLVVAVNPRSRSTRRPPARRPREATVPAGRPRSAAPAPVLDATDRARVRRGLPTVPPPAPRRRATPTEAAAVSWQGSAVTISPRPTASDIPPIRPRSSDSERFARAVDDPER